MSEPDNPIIAYFISVTHCPQPLAIEYLKKSHGKVDQALNLYYEQETNRHATPISSPTSPQQRRSTPIIIPAMIEFQKFIQLFNTSMNTCLLENSSKMMALAMQYAQRQRPTLSAHDLEHWQIHIKVDYIRLQTLLDHDMCAPLVWIEHFQHLLQGNVCQFFDCDHMFNIEVYSNQHKSFY